MRRAAVPFLLILLDAWSKKDSGVLASAPSQAIPPLLSWKPINAPCQALRVKFNSRQSFFSLPFFVLKKPFSFQFTAPASSQ